MNLYGYVDDDPLGFIDPLGLDKRSALMWGALLGGALLLAAVDGPLPFGDALGASLIAGGLSSGRVVPSFETISRALRQLQNPRLGPLEGRLTPERLQQLLQNPSAQRLFDVKTGNINVVQEVEGMFLRITVPRDAFRIISVGPIRATQVTNGLASGRFVAMP
jgi:hypothetical protein